MINKIIKIEKIHCNHRQHTQMLKYHFLDHVNLGSEYLDRHQNMQTSQVPNKQIDGECYPKFKQREDETILQNCL